jgi:hypothetical protein
VRAFVAWGLVLLLAGPLASPLASASHFEASFQPRNGNEWWIQVKVTASAPVDAVDARVNGGEWRPLDLKSYGDWAKSYQAPTGSLVEFRATGGSEVVVSIAYRWPSGEPATAPPPPPPPPPSGGSSASFQPRNGNEWWIQVRIAASERVVAADTRVDGGAWLALTLQSYGDWTTSTRAPEGSRVQFRATGESGAVATSGEHRWTSGEPIGGAPPPPPPPPPGGYAASFEPRNGNEWWIQVRVQAAPAPAAVDVRVNGATWRPLELKSYGDWAKSYQAPTGSVVEFRAATAGGEAAVSGRFAWPSGTPLDGGGGGNAAIVVQIDAGREIARVDAKLYGVSIADWNPSDYHPTQHAAFVAYLSALQPGILRWPSGHSSQEYRWERGPATGDETRVLSAAHVESFLGLAREVGAEPLLAVNLKTGTAEAAADLVRYVNVERGHNVTWWQLGNEPDHRDGLTSGPEQYAEDAVRFAQAMRAVDPRVKLVGGELMSGAHVMGANGKPDWMTPIADQAGAHLDALSWHYYPLDSGQSDPGSSAYPTREHLFQEVATDWRPSGMSFVEEVYPRLRSLRDAHSPGSELWLTETAEDSGRGCAEGICDTMTGALWTADILGRLAEQDADAVAKFVFKSGSTHRFNLVDHEMQPRPTYYAYWLLARHYGDHIVHATSDERAIVAAHASLRDDGKLAILLVNKGTVGKDVRIDVAGFAGRDATTYELRGDSYVDKTVDVNGMELTPTTVGSTPPGAVQAWSPTMHVPPYTIRLVVVSA